MYIAHTPQPYIHYLREARALVAPQVPVLAPQLKDNSSAVLHAIQGFLQKQGLDVQSFSGLDLNKTERHIYAAFLIGEMRKHMVSGIGRFAQLRYFCQLPELPGQNTSLAPIEEFAQRSHSTLETAATNVEVAFTQGSAPERSWFPLAAERYKTLGAIAQQVTPHSRIYLNPNTLQSMRITSVPLEGQYLDKALRTIALRATIAPFLRLIASLDLPEYQRLKAAHDLTYLPNNLAGRHIIELTQIISQCKGKLFQGTVEERRGHHVHIADKLETSAPYLPNATLKCPAKTPGGDGAINLLPIIHALVNKAHQQGIFSGQAT